MRLWCSIRQTQGTQYFSVPSFRPHLFRTCEGVRARPQLPLAKLEEGSYPSFRWMLPSVRVWGAQGVESKLALSPHSPSPGPAPTGRVQPPLCFIATFGRNEFSPVF